MQEEKDIMNDIRQKVEAAMKQWHKQKSEIVEVLREEVKFQVQVSVNNTIDNMNRLKDAISMDMKKWKSQRADLQLEIAAIQSKLEGGDVENILKAPRTRTSGYQDLAHIQVQSQAPTCNESINPISFTLDSYINEIQQKTRDSGDKNSPEDTILPLDSDRFAGSAYEEPMLPKNDFQINISTKSPSGQKDR